MRFKLSLIVLAMLAWASIGIAAASEQAARSAGAMKFQIQLIWGTNDPKSPDDKHKPVDAEVGKKLKALPLKWANYFLVNKKSLEVAPGGEKKEPISEKCAVEVQDKGKSTFEISLFGKGERVVKRSQTLHVGEMLVLGGNAPNETSWLVVVKRIE
ncbi:MAG TPA: hypothetical protein VLT36_05490 [Candidatus Dormibacteraeota bacterium]|nr:hypothetical protein [Candidatus Dormibacteraeota bacterium]